MQGLYLKSILWGGELAQTPEDPRVFPNREPQGTFLWGFGRRLSICSIRAVQSGSADGLLDPGDLSHPS